MFFLCGPDFILEIPEDTIDFANRNHLAVSIETTFDYNSQDYHKIMTFRKSFTYMLKYREQGAAACGCRFIWKKHAVSAVGFILFEDVRIKEELCGQMDEIFRQHFLYSEVSLYAGYSGIHRGIAETGEAVQESKNAMIFCKKSDGTKSSYHYHELGILRLLVNSNSREEL